MASRRHLRPIYIFLVIVLALVVLSAISYDKRADKIWRYPNMSQQRDKMGILTKEYKPMVKVPFEYMHIIHSLESSAGKEKPTTKDMENFIFVTYLSSNHFNEAKGMIATLQKNMPGYKIILYDLGLNKLQAQEVLQWCQIEYRLFNFTKYPGYVKDFHTYAFKALVIQEALQEFPAIHWADASYRFMCDKDKYLRILFNTAKNTNGMAFGHFGANLAYLMIHPGMFRFLPSNITKLHKLRMTSSGHGYLYKNNETLRRFIKPWVACSLTKDCISPKGATKSRKSLIPGRCHQYDQSALTLLLANNFNYNQTFYNFDSMCVAVKRSKVMPHGFHLQLC